MRPSSYSGTDLDESEQPPSHSGQKLLFGRLVDVQRFWKIQTENLMNRFQFAVSAGTLFAGLALALPATAQVTGSEGFGLINVGEGTAGSFAGDRFRPAIDREGILDVESADVGEHLDYDLGMFLGYSHNNLVLYSFGPEGDPNRPDRLGSLIEHRVGAHIQGAIGLFEWLKIGLDIPIVPFQYRGALPSNVTAAAPFFLLDETTQSGMAGGLGDIRVTPKIRILRAKDQFVNLAVIPNFTLPTNLPRNVYLGDTLFTLNPELALSRNFMGLRFAANVGYRFRFIQEVANQTRGHEITYRAGLGYQFQELTKIPLSLDWTVSGAAGVWPLADNQNDFPLETHVGATYDIMNRLQAFVGAGAGLLPGAGVPDFRGFAGVRYAPRARDRDNDGILDNDDACPDEPEDKDGFEDSDGCPDTDNDQDGILDADDKCPDDAEDKDGFEDEDGCPDTDNDKDGILDADDKCPDEAGPVENQGCPNMDKDGDGIFDKDDKCPDDPEDKDGFEDEDGCPDTDNDKDGILDKDDKCPDDAEDKDGFEDEDGCPDLDNDHDGIPDVDDKCPMEPETINGNEDEDGCPDKGKTMVRMTETKIEILDKVYFDTAKATIKPRSHNLLGQVASILKANPEVTKLRVEGHTDSRGKDAYNMELSEARSQSVRSFLVDKGIDPARLEAHGYGEDRPIDSNKSRRGRAKNRRVEFNIIEILGRSVVGEDAVIKRIDPSVTDPDPQPEAKKKLRMKPKAKAAAKKPATKPNPVVDPIAPASKPTGPAGNPRGPMPPKPGTK